MCGPNFSSPSSLWKVTHCPDWIHLTSKSNFRIRLLLGCHGQESNTSRFSMWKYGQSCGDPSCRLCGAALEDPTHFISSCNMLESKHRELLSHSPPQPTTTQGQEQIDLPDPAREPDSFASTCIMLGIDWIDDIEIQSILHQVSSRSQGLQTQTHPTITTFQLLYSGTLPEREATKKEHGHFDIPSSYQNRQLQLINQVWALS